MKQPSPLALYDQTALASAAPVIRRYSSSFRLASSLLPRRCRAAIATVYALVRIADEIVDGTAAEAGLDADEQRRRLDELETETFRAIASGMSSNLIVHAYASVARTAGFEPELTADFFASMRRDLEPVAFDEQEFQRYIHGSAEVVGLMCLRIFLVGHPVDDDTRARLDEGAIRLGAAFQKVNFLRDLADDHLRLERSYLPGVVPSALTDADVAAAVADIRCDLAAAREGARLLPPDTRRAVLTAADVYGELLRRIERTPASELLRVRVSVPAPVKAALALRRAVLPHAAGREATR